MRNTLAILRKELRGYFGSPTAYIVTAAFWVLAGFFFTQILADILNASSQADFFAAQLGRGQGFDAGTQFLQRFLGAIVLLFLFVLPMLTMGLYAEERRRGTMELLATSPLTNLSVAIGKWLASLLWCVTMLLPFFVLEVLALSSAEPGMNFALLAAAHVGLLMMASAILALGLFVSSLTDNTLIAAVGTFSMVLLLWVIDALAGNRTGAIASGLRHLSLLRHYESWLQGIVTSDSLVVFAGLTVFGLFLTVQSVEALRWQTR
ncbi:ABC transporter permease [Synechococcus sp. PCC 7336]|uniref:ABC transporter permease n=1 Tax=Synechococcus sp. PCC 7336 TaxID=195250 RepID=UPI0003490220|nr:ABC transporter permease [Synechococcus sp. PCC 7336]